MTMTPAQKAIVQKMSPGKWYCAYTLKTSLNVLRALVAKGIVQSHGEGGIGSSFSPRTTIQFRLKQDYDPDEIEITR